MYMDMGIQFICICTEIRSINKLHLITSIFERINCTNLFCQLGLIGRRFQETYSKKDLKNVGSLSRMNALIDY